MTDLAATSMSERLGIPGFSPQSTDDLLLISGTDPHTIYVINRPRPDDKHTIGFGLQPTGPFFFHGIKWETSQAPEADSYAMFITYIIESPEIQEIICPTLHYSKVYRPTPEAKAQQDMCIPWGGAMYAFGVKVPDQDGIIKIVDPIIVVTPLSPVSADGRNGKA